MRFYFKNALKIALCDLLMLPNVSYVVKFSTFSTLHYMNLTGITNFIL